MTEWLLSLLRLMRFFQPFWILVAILDFRSRSSEVKLRTDFGHNTSGFGQISEFRLWTDFERTSDSLLISDFRQTSNFGLRTSHIRLQTDSGQISNRLRTSDIRFRISNFGQVLDFKLWSDFRFRTLNFSLWLQTLDNILQISSDLQHWTWWV